MKNNRLNSGVFFYASALLAIVNYFIFITPIRTSFETSQPILIVYYTILYLASTFSPSLIVFGLIRKHKLSLVIIVLLFFASFVFAFISTVPKKVQTSFIGEKEDEIFLELTEIKELEQLKSINFCFKILYPSYFPNSSYGKLSFDKAYGSAKKCENQVISIIFDPSKMALTQIPSKYDFNSRSDEGDLQSLREKAMKGTRVKIKGIDAYRTEISEAYFPLGSPSYSPSRANILYWETDSTLIFMRYEPEGIFSEEEYIKIAESMMPIR